MLSAIAARWAVISGGSALADQINPSLTPGDAARATGEPPARSWRRPPLPHPAAEPQLLTAPNSSAMAATANPARLRQPATMALTAPAPSRFPTPDPPPPRAWTGDRREPANRADQRGCAPTIAALITIRDGLLGAGLRKCGSRLQNDHLPGWPGAREIRRLARPAADAKRRFSLCRGGRRRCRRMADRAGEDANRFVHPDTGGT